MIRVVLKLLLIIINKTEDIFLRKIKNPKVRKVIDGFTDWLQKLVD